MCARGQFSPVGMGRMLRNPVRINILHLLHCSGCQIITAAELHFISLQVDLAPGNGDVMKTTLNEETFEVLNQTGSQMLAGLKD